VLTLVRIGGGSAGRVGPNKSGAWCHQTILPVKKENYQLTSLKLVQENGEPSIVEKPANPKDSTITLSGTSKSFKQSPGGIHNHEGHQILTSSGTQIEIHLLAQHGQKVKEGHLKDRLEEMKELFRSKRQEKKDAQQAAIDAMSTRLNELLNAPEPTKEKKKAKNSTTLRFTVINPKVDMKRITWYLKQQATKFQTCIQCTACSAVCPHGAITIKPDMRVYQIDQDVCTGCMECVTHFGSTGCLVAKSIAVFGSARDTSDIIPMEIPVV